MQPRTIDGVLRELREDAHVPMTQFVEELRKQPWATKLTFDLSMLRLWLARPGVQHVEVMVTYGDGRMGGRPTPPYFDKFEITDFTSGQAPTVTTQNSVETIEKIRRWLEVPGADE